MRTPNVPAFHEHEPFHAFQGFNSWLGAGFIYMPFRGDLGISHPEKHILEVRSMDHAEAGKEIRRAVDTGKVEFGTKESLHELRQGNGQLLVIAHNTPPLVAEDLRHLATLAEVPVYSFAGNGLELGSVCGKPYVISTLLVMDAGKSKVQILGDAKAMAAETEEEAAAPKKGRKKKAAN